MRQPKHINDFQTGDRVRVSGRYDYLGNLRPGQVVTVSRIKSKGGDGGWLYIDGYTPERTDDEEGLGYGLYIFDVLEPGDPDYLPEPTDEEIAALFGIQP